MLVCSQPDIQRWWPDFSASGARSPSWTRLRVDGQELCNALEDVVWSPNPVQVQLCEMCGTPGCNSGGYADLSRLGGQVLWTSTEEDSRCGPLWALRQGAAVFPLPVWQALRERLAFLPAADALPATTRRMLAQAWQAEVRGRQFACGHHRQGRPARHGKRPVGPRRCSAGAAAGSGLVCRAARGGGAR